MTDQTVAESPSDEHLARTIEKITKLRKLAESAAAIGNLHEANAATEQAARLVARYQLDEAELQAASPDMEIEVPEESPHPLFSESISTHWKSALAQSLAEHHGVAVFRRRRRFPEPEVSIHLVGRKTDVKLVRLFFAWLLNDFDVTAKIKSGGRGRTWVNSFLLGAVTGLDQALQRARASTRTEAVGGGVSTAALAIYDSRLDDAKAALAILLPDLKTAPARKINWDPEASHAGRKHGEQAGAALGKKAIT